MGVLLLSLSETGALLRADIQSGGVSPSVLSGASATIGSSGAKSDTKDAGGKTSSASVSAAPKVVAPTRRGAPTPASSSGSAARTTGSSTTSKGASTPQSTYKEPPSLKTGQTPGPGVYGWRTNVTATVFWIGERPTANNPTPNHKSSWDTAWRENYGGFDDPNPENRVINFVLGEFRPKEFMPRLNPFYVALPYNDCVSSLMHKPEASRVVPWFQKEFVRPGLSVCKGKWVQIFYKGKYCFAQWEDCGPFTTDDWGYVFGSNAPKTKGNGGAGIDLSPAVRDYLGLRSGEKVHWRFVEFVRIPKGPWAKYGDNNPFVKRQPTATEIRAEMRRGQLEKIKTDTNRFTRK